MPDPGTTRTLRTLTEPAALERLHELVARLWEAEPGVAEADRTAFETALAEVVANSIEHASPHGPVPLEVRLEVRPDSLVAEVEDAGPEVPAPVLDRLHAQPAEPVDPLAEHGRGLLLLRACTDDVTVSRQGGRSLWRFVRGRV